VILILIIYPWAMGKGLDNNIIIDMEGINMMKNSVRRVNTSIVIIMLSLVEI